MVRAQGSTHIGAPTRAFSSLSLSLLWALDGKKKDSLDRGHRRKHLLRCSGFYFSRFDFFFRDGTKWNHSHKDLTDLGIGRGKAVSASLDARLTGVARDSLVFFFLCAWASCFYILLELPKHIRVYLST